MLTVFGIATSSESPAGASSESGAWGSGAGDPAPEACGSSAGVSERESVSLSPFLFFFFPPVE